MLFPQSPQLNHFLRDSFALPGGKNILFFRKIPNKKSDNLIFFETVIRRRFFPLNFSQRESIE